MSTTSSDADGVTATGARLGARGRTRPRVDPSSVRPERVVALRRRSAPRFYLTYLQSPNDGSDPAVPLGTCLVLRAIGGQTPRRVSVELPHDVVRTASSLRRGASVGIATPGELDELAALGTVFVEWVSRDGVTRTAWLRVPPTPARYRAGTAR
ncbi:hypothetical protein F1C15_12775 [Frigoribacterium sp. NBH87]|uniref:hypothetical protein n=1 Tax=Frigoribacterium sp. NBH87 TaxID=2596916 RepID=UPI00162A4F21|nr:hypothetical protein [Frigoribacterium sp. NBH87]QNE44571.1 hypothetical protein F1C15_12775 [Frigoribacterium sp. NBH87]